jgi:GT2 family glycosyltransferase
MAAAANSGGAGGAALAVIVPHYDDVGRLVRCLGALMPQVAAAGPGAVEVVVADNGSTEDLAPVRAAHPGLRIVTEPAKGAAMARNRGVAETTAPALAFLDADCVPAPGWLARARAVVAEGTLTGGRIDVFAETAGPRSGAEAFEAVFAFRQRDYVERKGFSVTANLVTTRAVFEATGPMVPGLSEDMDWCRRATAKGFALRYDDALAVAHPARQDWPALERKWRRLSAEMCALNGKGPAARARWALRGLAMAPSALLHAPQVLGHPGLSGAERWRGMGTLMRLRLARGAWMLRQAATGRP